VVGNTRSDIYLAPEAPRVLVKDSGQFLQRRGRQARRPQEVARQPHEIHAERGVKVLVAIALALGTMIGWKQIAATVGGQDR
jgi:phosphate/sulfate permease